MDLPPGTVLVDKNLLDLLAFLALAGVVSTAAVLVYVFGVIGIEPLKLAATVSGCKRRKVFCALVRVGRYIRVVQASYLGENRWGAVLAGTPHMWEVPPESVYQLAGANVFVATASTPKSLSPREFEALVKMSDPREQRRLIEAVQRLVEEYVVPLALKRAEELEERAGQAQDPSERDKILEQASRLRQLAEQFHAEASALGSGGEALALLKKLEASGVKVKNIPVQALKTPINFDVIDTLTHVTSIGATGLMTVSMLLTESIDVVKKRYAKQLKQGFPIGVFIVVLLVAVLLIALMSMHGGR